jgi:hypothetical protein
VEPEAELLAESFDKLTRLPCTHEFVSTQTKHQLQQRHFWSGVRLEGQLDRRGARSARIRGMYATSTEDECRRLPIETSKGALVVAPQPKIPYPHLSMQQLTAGAGAQQELVVMRATARRFCAFPGTIIVISFLSFCSQERKVLREIQYFLDESSSTAAVCHCFLLRRTQGTLKC